jgi:farnesyl diphosphate synthase
MVKLLAAAAGSRGMAGGQQIDLESTGKRLDPDVALRELEFMHIHKTGALIRAAVLLGAGCGPSLTSRDKAALDRYAKAVGLAFQVVDDVLDAEANTATLGKTAGKDQKQGKPTYVAALGRGAARELAEQLRSDAHAALEVLGARGGKLRSLADFIVLRKF